MEEAVNHNSDNALKRAMMSIGEASQRIVKNSHSRQTPTEMSPAPEPAPEPVEEIEEEPEEDSATLIIEWDDLPDLAKAFFNDEYDLEGISRIEIAGF